MGAEAGGDVRFALSFESLRIGVRGSLGMSSVMIASGARVGVRESLSWSSLVIAVGARSGVRGSLVVSSVIIATGATRPRKTRV